MNLYWNQWDRDDLDSWQGKEIVSVLENEEKIEINYMHERTYLGRLGIHPINGYKNEMYEYGLMESMFR